VIGRQRHGEGYIVVLERSYYSVAVGASANGSWKGGGFVGVEV